MGVILVVEDERGIADTLKAILEDEGHTVVTFGNGREAVTWLAGERPDLVVSDLMMPVMSGQALYAAMQADQRLHDVPFLAVTALDGAMVRRQLPGVVSISKPFRINHLLKAVRTLLRTPDSAEDV